MDEKLSEAELQRHMNDAVSVLQVGRRYWHYKGNEYRIVTLAIIEATNEPAVVAYEALYSKELQFIRPISDWLVTVERQGEAVPRFTLI